MSRSVLVDVTKVLASQLIVLHHLGLYAPMADVLVQAWPRLMAFIVDDGRMAVQPFLVMGGFLAARSLGRRHAYPVLELALQRYVRLMPPLACALLLVVVATVMVGRELAQAEWVSPLPDAWTLLVHLLLLQDVLGVPALSAGAWYVAIDLQLFTLFVVLLSLASRLPRQRRDAVVTALLAGLTIASILVFSRRGSLDMWAIYFFSAYGLGALAALAQESRLARFAWWAVVTVLLVDWLIAPRERPLWALATALALHAGAQVRWGASAGFGGRVIRSLSDWSYGVFVCHFAVIVLASGLWQRWALSGLATAVAACLLVVLVSVALGAAVQALCDRGLARLRLGGMAAQRR